MDTQAGATLKSGRNFVYFRTKENTPSHAIPHVKLGFKKFTVAPVLSVLYAFWY